MNLIDCRDSAEPLRVVCRGERFRPYRLAHRQLRLELSTALSRCARWTTDIDSRQQLASEVEAMLASYAAHQAAEHEALHAPLRARAPRALLAFDSEHEDQRAAIEVLRALLTELRANPDPAIADELELRLSQFVADGLAHMAEEETTLTRALWQHFSDAELRGFSELLVTKEKK